MTTDANFWSDQNKARKILTEIKILQERLETWKRLHDDILSLEEMYGLVREEDHQDMEGDLLTSLQDIQARFDKALVIELLSGEADRNDAFLTIHAGSGGTEACDWASMLYRMYLRWAERHDFSVETIDFLEAEGGIKSVTVQVSGEYAYGYLKGEMGVRGRKERDRLGFPDSVLCVSTLYDGQGPSEQILCRKCAGRDGWRARSLYRGLSALAVEGRNCRRRGR